MMKECTASLESGLCDLGSVISLIVSKTELLLKILLIYFQMEAISIANVLVFLNKQF